MTLKRKITRLAMAWTALAGMPALIIGLAPIALAHDSEVQNSPVTGQPTISGPLQVGRTLIADTSGISDADGLSNVTFEYQWISDNAEIDDGKSAVYTLQESDEDNLIKVRVDFTDDAGNQESVTGTTGAPVEPDPDHKCPGSAYVQSVRISWGDPETGEFTTIRVNPTEAAREAAVGSGGQLVSEFLRCMSRLDGDGAMIYAMSSWGPPVTFFPTSTDRTNWQTFIDQLQCHDAPPLNLFGDNTYTLWDLEGHRLPTRDLFVWGVSSCNWGLVEIAAGHLFSTPPFLPRNSLACATVGRLPVLSRFVC